MVIEYIPGKEAGKNASTPYGVMAPDPEYTLPFDTDKTGIEARMIDLDDGTMVCIEPGESIDNAVARFKKAVSERAGLLKSSLYSD